MHWIIAAPFIDESNLEQSTWLERYVPSDRHQFGVVPRRKPLENWHNQTSSVTGYKEWLTYWEHGKSAIQSTQGGVITVFPQLASTVGFHQRLRLKHVPVVAWLFNVGTCSTGIRQYLAKMSLKDVDCFVVHTRRECQIYSEWLDLPLDRFEFVPYQVPEIPLTHPENTTSPFLVAIGSAHRDFQTLFAAAERLNLPTVVASGKRALAGLTLPPQVTAPLGIGKQECLQLSQEARINIVPLAPNDCVTAAGQVTIVEAMRMGRVVVATRCNGAEDYIIHGENGFFVEPGSVEDLVKIVEMLWDDSELRNRVGQSARQYAIDNFSDEAAGSALGRILDRISDATQKNK
jgi:Glycosyl transferases group 1